MDDRWPSWIRLYYYTIEHFGSNSLILYFTRQVVTPSGEHFMETRVKFYWLELDYKQFINSSTMTCCILNCRLWWGLFNLYTTWSMQLQTENKKYRKCESHVSRLKLYIYCTSKKQPSTGLSTINTRFVHPVLILVICPYHEVPENYLNRDPKE